MRAVTFRFLPTDIIDHSQVQRRGNRMILIARIVLGGLGLGVCAAMWSTGTVSPAVFLIALGVGVGVVLLLNLVLARYVLPAQARRVIAQQKSFQGDWTAQWDDQGIAFTTLAGRSQMAWSDFFKWRESKLSLVLFHSEIAFSALPKRALTEAQTVEVRGFITKALGGRGPRA